MRAYYVSAEAMTVNSLLPLLIPLIHLREDTVSEFIDLDTDTIRKTAIFLARIPRKTSGRRILQPRICRKRFVADHLRPADYNRMLWIGREVCGLTGRVANLRTIFSPQSQRPSFMLASG